MCDHLVVTRFTVRLRGYDRHQVDELAERVQRALAGEDEPVEELRDDLNEVEFDIVLRGYDRHEVDATVPEWIERLDARL